MVIIAGTCITYNFLNSRKEFLGGAISPGLNMRFLAMHTFTGKLPLITLDKEYDEFLGRDTRESMLSGVQAGSLAETLYMIGAYAEQYPGLRVFLCGGDAEFFDKRLKNSIFADRIVLDRELILKGLDRVLNYQYK
ncbi:type III pantothenate kinase [Anseongella ginsenosidimutans]|nr:type III pantothenate kinase [Anseongella ginsenosidimutans]